ncbi:hypothetical protein ACFFTN_26360, partial [Aminobacter aganoensis]|uniref:hypothetical protein n=1 Tax=Aminobacter aganoensis TaxID=83264 RepID=UPI001AEE7472
VFGRLSQKIRKSWKKVVDSLKGWRLYTPQQRGRRAAGGPGVRFQGSFFDTLVDRIQESRVSDTRLGLKAKAARPRHRVEAMSVL